MDRQMMDEWIIGRYLDGYRCLDGQMDGWIFRYMDDSMNKKIDRWIFGWVDGHMDWFSDIWKIE